MSSRRKKKFEKLIQLHDELQEISKDMPNGIMSSTNEMPLIDMFEIDEKLEIKIYIPEFDKEEIELGVSDHILEVHAQKKETSDTYSRRYLIKESRSIYSRKISLPEGTAPRELKAKYEDNILEIFIPYKKSDTFKFKVS